MGMGEVFRKRGHGVESSLRVLAKCGCHCKNSVLKRAEVLERWLGSQEQALFFPEDGSSVPSATQDYCHQHSSGSAGHAHVHVQICILLK